MLQVELLNLMLKKKENSKLGYLRNQYTTAKRGEYGASMQKANAIGDIASSIGGIGDSLAPGAGLALGKELGVSKYMQTGFKD